MPHLKRNFFLFLVGVLVWSGMDAREAPLAGKDLIQALVQEVSGEIAYKYTVLISHFDRIQASEGWHDAAVWVKKELEKMGYADAAIEGWPSNGSTYYYTYKTPIGWRARSAELWMLSPDKKRLCSYEEIPLTLVKHSNAADVEAELVDVGTGVGEQSYKDKDVRGKIVLATAYTGDVMREAVLKRGALGVVTWYPPDVRPGYPTMIRYTAIWPTWEERNKIGFGFNVSKNQGWQLKKQLEEGKNVVLRAEVQAEYYESQAEIVTASYPGSTEPDREVLIIGHLCHPLPSANDNASGSGGMLEMARALRRMVDLGLIEPPKRTIRFLWVPEFAGTVPYIKAHLERTRNTLSVINCDMIGEDLHLTGGTFNITCTPDSVPSYLNDVVVNFTRLAESLNLRSLNGSNHPFAYRIRPFSGGSDHFIFNDGALRVPAVMFGHGDTFHHTSLDTPDKVDASELRRVCFIALGASYYLASAAEEEAREISRIISRNGLSRLSEDYYDSLGQMLAAENAENLFQSYKHVLNVIEHSAKREMLSVLSTLVFVQDEPVKKWIKNSTGNLQTLRSAFQIETQKHYKNQCQKMGVKPRAIKQSAEERTMSRIIPVRSENFVCPLQSDWLAEKLGPEVLEEIKLRRYTSYEALNFADGKRSILGITKAVSAEYGPVNIQDVLSFFRILERAGLMTLKKI
ncbi:MAG: DUF4910 domain-containing protein [Candidatus Aminicenantes bacterium]|jgi:aminopeptidase-like protein